MCTGDTSQSFDPHPRECQMGKGLVSTSTTRRVVKGSSVKDTQQSTTSAITAQQRPTKILDVIVVPEDSDIFGDCLPVGPADHLTRYVATANL